MSITSEKKTKKAPVPALAQLPTWHLDCITSLPISNDNRTQQTQFQARNAPKLRIKLAVGIVAMTGGMLCYRYSSDLVPSSISNYFPSLDSLPSAGDWLVSIAGNPFTYSPASPITAAAKVCEQSPILDPTVHPVSDVYQIETKRNLINWLSGAVKIPTEGFDGMGEIGHDERWDVFAPFHDYLERSFPLVHTHLSLEKINTYALAYEWAGSDKSKSPLMLAAHQDVVPVEPSTIDSWTHPPFSGHFDGEYIWGRGSSDDKASLIGILSAIELLIQEGFKPERTVVLAFGMDEETGGKVGAAGLNQFLLGKYGKDSMFMLVDEGNGITDQYDRVFASPAVAEKGYLDVELTIRTPGGHSSIPPVHTGIGLLAIAISELEANPSPLALSRTSPFYEGMQCVAEYGHGVDEDLVKVVKKSRTSDKALKMMAKMLAKISPQFKASMSTTRAVDVIFGGVKVNALPEISTALVNHRISVDSSVQALQEQMTETLRDFAQTYKLEFTAFGKPIFDFGDEKKGSINLAPAFSSDLEPAPISPYNTSSSAWNVLTGSIKSTWTSSQVTGNRSEIIIAPSAFNANTDTKRYWNLTNNIYRFEYALPNSAENIHTVDEHIQAESVIEGVRFFQTLILNADQA